MNTVTPLLMINISIVITGRDGDIRLFGSNRQYEGIVEVNYNGKWGMVCRGSEFSLSEVRAVCRQLNLGDDDVSPMSATR